MLASPLLPVPTTPTWQVSNGQGGSGGTLDAVLVWLLSFCGLVGLILWYDNAQGITGNGIFKALQLKPWVQTPATASLDASNYLYFPIVGRLCALLDVLGVFPGDPRRQMAVIHAASAAACLSVLYLFARRLTGDRAIAWLATLFHLAGGFFLNLAISNEDIMPSYTLMFAAMVLAVLWFVRPTVRRVAIVSAIFTLAWLFEWRLMFPTLPAMLLALAIASGRPLARLGWIATFLLTSVAVVAVLQLLWGSQPGNPYRLVDLVWTAKGVETGWAGFTAAKWWFLWAGISETLLGGRNLGDLASLPLYAREMGAATVVIVGLAVAALLLFWHNRSVPQTRILVAVFGGTFVAGEVMNVYSQPQDPQMQINVMPWLTIAAILLVAHAARTHRRAALSTFACVSAGILAYNVHALAATRGEDTRWRATLERIEQHVPPARSFLLVHGFEGLVSQTYYHWNGDWKFFDTLGPAPTPATKFKVLALVSGAVNRPRLTGPELAAELEQQILQAMALGYDVVAADVWNWSREKMESALSTVADKGKSDALYEMLHTKFTGTPVYVDPVAGPFVRLTPIAPRQ
ncbi:hypothetical protein LJ725_24745 [Reyranella aquatilis]|uniref:Glycosyltransferase RgtA/B/C/D-like domain-containing protein n=1 Tax=Reyranella aquatilis TaxID=2035356 RepID=A0ABS8L1K2_9HYPH|nr:hypothetical protein [Reyranella aquatilis]MCC8432197.1 hypothetical protein [Reyranella aquatilis]